MIPASSRVLVIGGNSAIARHLLELLPEARAVARHGGETRVAAIGSYDRLASDHFTGIDTVVNCAGMVSGTEAALRTVNVDLQARLARVARDAGVGRYIAIGSFSIFGRCERINGDTPACPMDAYGRSKLDGEHAIGRLQTDRFQVLSVAFPAIVGTTRRSKVQRMLRVWRRTGIWPVPPHDIERSMIGAHGAARILAQATRDDRLGRVLAADPTVFSYRRVATWLREDVGGSFRTVSIPMLGARIIRRWYPSFYHSVMADSVLDPSSNYAIECGVGSSLRRELTFGVAQGTP